MLGASRCHSRLVLSSLRSLRRRLSSLQTYLHRSPHPTATNSSRQRLGANAGRGGGNQPVRWRRGELFTNASSSKMGEIEDGSGFATVEIRCRKREADILSEALLCYGASSASMDELGDCEDDDEICICSIFTNHEDAHRCISLAADSIGFKKIPRYEMITSQKYNWLEIAKESFHPIEVADGLWIVPEWRTPIDSRATNVILNPGMAFGTGEHPTTKLCLILLNGLIKGGETLLDYGTGSGILGIAALKMGASLSAGVDIDTQAIFSTRQNIALNQIDPDRMELYLAGSKVSSLPSDGRAPDDNEDLTLLESKLSARQGTFDIVLANILLNPLLELAEEIISYGKPGAVVGLSGILTEQVPQIESRYSKYLKGMSISEIDGWACLSGVKM